MHRRMLIESDPFETRIAVQEDERLVEVFVERHRSRGLVGNIYKGRVTRVLAGMQAAFLDVGLDRDAFLYVADAQPVVATEAEEPGASAARAPQIPIQDLVREGQEILVQVAKDPLPQKGARVTTQIALPARFLVMLPGAAKVAVSRRIDDPDERERLQEVVGGLEAESGLIVRTAGEGRGVDEFAEDLRYLGELWAEIEGRVRSATAPHLVHSDLEPALRVVRDLVDESFREITVQGDETFHRVATFFDRVQPALADRVRRHEDEQSLFELHAVEGEIEAALRGKVWLASGGYVIISPTEALVAIDVNTGRYTGGADLEETVFKTNMEAVRVLARQIRLRDLGGIIVVDFIDMERAENRDRVLEELHSELAKDRARSRILGLSDFGLVQITRKRSRANLRGVLTDLCPECGGRGRVVSSTTICLAIRREALRDPQRFADRDPLLVVHPALERALTSTERDVLGDIEQTMGKKVGVKADDSLHREQFEVLAV